MNHSATIVCLLSSINLFVFSISNWLMPNWAYAQNRHLPSTKLTVERIFSDPSLNGPSPRAVKISPDGRRVTYLKGKETNSKQTDLWEFDRITKTNRLLVDSSQFVSGSIKEGENLSDEEKARRERLRIDSQGIVEYFWAEGGNALVFPVQGNIFYYSLDKNTSGLRRLTDGKHEMDPHVSHKGKYVSFVRDSNLFVIETATGREIQITHDGSETVVNGRAEFIAQEELNRFTAQWWSKDDRYLAFTRTDESEVEIAQRYEINGDGFKVFDQRYPRTGTKNVKVKVGVVDLTSPSQVKWLNLGPNDDIYLARVNWLPDNSSLAVQILSRNQKRLDLLFFDVVSLKSKIILTEKDKHWVNLHDDLNFLEKSNQFIWASERSGKKQFYLYDLDGHFVRNLTSNDWPVGSVLTIDSDERYLYFSATGENPIENHLYRLSLGDDHELKRITTEPGTHFISMSKNADTYVDVYSHSKKPPVVSVHQNQGNLETYIEKNDLIKNHPLALYLSDFSKEEFGSFRTKDGVELYYHLVFPQNYQSGNKYPLVVDVYGGPHAQMVKNTWSGERGVLWHQVLAEHGYLVLQVDNRGGANRGHDFETPIHRQLGNVEVQDQKAAVEFLISKGMVDPRRVGIFGWSYGGYMTLMALFKEPEIFKVGVSIAPVSNWELYDTCYTERYLDTPHQNPEGYKKSSVFPYVDHSIGNFRGKLLMVHGMADDNVLFTNSTRVFERLQEMAIPFEMMTYPGSKHGIYGQKRRIHLFNTILDFFERSLK